jgi:hypothetical protein
MMDSIFVDGGREDKRVNLSGTQIEFMMRRTSADACFALG